MHVHPRPVMQAFRIVVALQMIVSALIPGLALFEITNWTIDQTNWVYMFIGVIVAAVAYALGLRAESQVTPVSAPRLSSTTPLVPANQEPPIV